MLTQPTKSFTKWVMRSDSRVMKTTTNAVSETTRAFRPGMHNESFGMTCWTFNVLLVASPSNEVDRITSTERAENLPIFY
jgi:hypothetical protein